MRKIKPLKLKWHYIKDEDSEKSPEYAYNRIFNIAKQNILDREKAEKKMQTSQKQP